MNSTIMIKQILDAHKKVFEDSLNTMIAFQEHAEKMASILWEGAAFLPVESKQVMDDWKCRYKNCLDDFRTNVDKRFKLLEYYFLNAADQVESSMHTVVDKAVPACQDYEVTKKPAVKGKKEEVSTRKTVKKTKVTLKNNKPH